MTKNKLILISFLFLLSALFLAPGFSFAQSENDEIIVKLSDDIDLDDAEDEEIVDDILRDSGLEKKADIAEGNMIVLRSSEGESAKEKIDEISADPRVEYAQPNYHYYPMSIIPTDTYFDQQWALHSASGVDINAPEAWEISLGNQTPPVVALLDSGVVYSHSDLTASMWDGTLCKDESGNALGNCTYGYDFESSDTDPMASTSFHGTMIAGIIAAQMNNGLGISGLAPNAKIMAIKFDLTTEGAFTTADAIRGINFAKQNGAKIINASWGGTDIDLLLKNAIESFDGVFVTAAGNGGEDSTGDNNDVTATYPCAYNSPNIICVAATDSNDQLASFSNYGISTVDVAAPGVHIITDYSDGGYAEIYAYADGTSMSVGFVSGLAALLWGKDSSLTAAQVKAIILNSGDSLPALSGKTVTGKRINALAALGGSSQVTESIIPTDPFVATSISFNSDVKKGKTNKSKVTLNFNNVANASEFMISRRADFTGESWQAIKSNASISLSKKKGTKTYYVKFRDTNGFESMVHSKKVAYVPKSREIRNSKDRVKRGKTIIQSGKNFSKKAEIALYFSEKPIIIKTNSKGAFSLSYVVNKPKGKYSWYAKDLKTGKKTKRITYTIL